MENTMEIPQSPFIASPRNLRRRMSAKLLLDFQDSRQHSSSDLHKLYSNYCDCNHHSPSGKHNSRNRGSPTSVALTPSKLSISHYTSVSPVHLFRSRSTGTHHHDNQSHLHSTSQYFETDWHKAPRSDYFRKAVVRISSIVLCLALCLWLAVVVPHFGVLSWRHFKRWHLFTRMKTESFNAAFHPRTIFLDSSLTLPVRLRATVQMLQSRKAMQNISLMYPMVDSLYLQHLQNSEDFAQIESLESDDCQAQYNWQLDSRPNCNVVHELDMSNLYHAGSNGLKQRRVKLIANGYWSDIWTVVEKDNNVPHNIDFELNDKMRLTSQKRFIVAKTLRFRHDLTLRNMDRNRRDFMTMEHLTSSKSVVDIYGYCSVAGIVEYADGGDLDHVMLPRDKLDYLALNFTSLEKLRMATQAVMGLAALHNVDKEGQASIAHTDIGTGQFVFVNGMLKLNDFNRARFISKSKVNNTNCPYRVGKNPGKWRSPEEYKYEPQSEKVDMFSFGNVLYVLLQQKRPFGLELSEDAQQWIINGTRPAVDLEIQKSTDPLTIILSSAMQMCHEHNPNNRPTARQIENMFKAALRKYDPGQLEKWGVV